MSAEPYKQKSLEKWSRIYHKKEAWGILTSVDIHDCNPETIRDANKIKEYVFELCARIDMKRFRECVVVDFGEDERVAGFSMMQLIETSLISGHFANQTNKAFIDIFSCKPYSPDEVVDFTKKFFEGKTAKVNIIFRK